MSTCARWVEGECCWHMYGRKEHANTLVLPASFWRGLGLEDTTGNWMQFWLELCLGDLRVPRGEEKAEWVGNISNWTGLKLGGKCLTYWESRCQDCRSWHHHSDLSSTRLTVGLDQQVGLPEPWFSCLGLGVMSVPPGVQGGLTEMSITVQVVVFCDCHLFYFLPCPLSSLMSLAEGTGHKLIPARKMPTFHMGSHGDSPACCLLLSS